MPRTGAFDKPEAAKALASALKRLPDIYMDCRDPGIRHPWTVVVDFHVIDQHQEGRRKTPVIARDSVCSRCSTQKQEVFIVTKRGLEKIRNTYTYPEDYAIPGIPRGVKPAIIIWQEQYRRAMEVAASAARGERESAER